MDLDTRGETTRGRILEVLRRRGPSTLQQLAADVGITRMGVHQHLKLLLDADLVNVELERGGVGRPRHRYGLTEAAADLFPRRYDALASGLLAGVKAIGGEALLDQIFLERCDRLERQYAERVFAKPLRDRVAAVAGILEESGYMADWQQVDERTFIVREHNCAIFKVAQEHAVACKYELILLKRLLGADVRRERHLASGDSLCAYLVRRPTQA